MAVVDLIIDLGSSYTTIYKSGEGVVLSEPSLVLVSGEKIENGKIIEFGLKARGMVGKLPSGCQLLSPIQEGAITYRKATRAMLIHFLDKVVDRNDYFFKPKVRAFVNIPCGSGDEERLLIEELFNSIGIQEVYMLEAPLFACYGSASRISDESPIFVVDIGGGVTDIALIGEGGILKGYSFGVGGMAMDRGIVSNLTSSIGHQVGVVTAEELKKEIGSLIEKENLQVSVFGKNAQTGKPRAQAVSSNNIFPMLDYFYGKIADLVLSVLKELPLETLEYLFENGIYFTGGGSNVDGLSEYMKSKLKLPIIISANREFSTVKGGARLLEDGETFNKLLKIE